MGKTRTEKSMELMRIMLKRGYPKEFCEQITLNLNTDWTAQRMIGYLSHYKKLPMEDVADEMLAILSDRSRIMQKKDMEATNARWNEIMYNGFPTMSTKLCKSFYSSSFLSFAL